MDRYFAQVNFVVEANSEADAAQIQERVRVEVARTRTLLGDVVEATADEAVELDEFGS